MRPTSRLSRQPISGSPGSASGTRTESRPRGFDPSVFTREKESRSLCFGPLHYEPNYRYPLFVWLHGPGEDEQSLVRIIPEMSLRNYVAVAPRGPYCNGGMLRSWAGVGTGSDVSDGVQSRILGAMDEAKRKYSIHTDRVFIGGFGVGGTTALRMAMLNPGLFAGVLSIDGPVPRGGRPLLRWGLARRLAVFLGAGLNTFQYPVSRICDDLRLLHSAGFGVTLRHYPWGHELRPQILQDMDRWIMEMVTSVRR
ncbi:MAG: hypothetical protein Q4C47_02945 [Planctomycetia bacterium]|nr:hypothetical protein [Planctomycetia bacterium]